MNYDQILLDLGKALFDLLNVMDGTPHGILRGSHEAALFEAQGGQIGPGAMNHLADVRNTAQAIRTSRDALNLAINRLFGVDPAVGSRVKDICEPVLKQSDEYMRTAAETERVALELRRTDPTRFQGVMLGRGGMGPEVLRSSQGLVTNQLNRQAAQLASRGIEPRLIPSTRSALEPVMTMIRQLPTTIDEAKDKLLLILATMRRLLIMAARRAMAAGRTVLAAALSAIESALVSMGSRLTTPAPVIDQRVIDHMRRLLYGASADAT